MAMPSAEPLYKIQIDTHRGEIFTKNAYIFDRENDGNVALILSGSYHDQDASYGMRLCDISQGELYAALMFERKWNEKHSLSVGFNGHYDNFHTYFRPEHDASTAPTRMVNTEAVGGAYGQYTFNLDERLIAMAGVRYDYNSVYGSLFTPRMHLRWNPTEALTLHASAGRGYRSPQPLAEYSYLLASSRALDIAQNLHIESAWNFGAGASVTTYPLGKKLTLGAEYYYTDFQHQLMVDLDSNPHAAQIFTSDNQSYSHALQVEATIEPIKDLSILAAWRYTDVKIDYGQGLVQKPLTSRQKALFTVGYAPNMGIWQFDVTCAVNGAGRMPTPYTTAAGTESWNRNFKAYAQLSAQITRNFRHWAVYVGGENLTGYRQPSPIIGASNPWGSEFDATMIYGPLNGAMIYVGVRYNFTKFL
jgi:outer membrane receptor protein involved in Fe transport